MTKMCEIAKMATLAISDKMPNDQSGQISQKG